MVERRPHLAFPTVEIRSDAQPLQEEAICARRLGVLAHGPDRAVDEGEPLLPPHRLIEENFWRAIRHGLSVSSST